MMPNPYQEYSKHVVADRVGEAHRDRLAKLTRRARISTTRRTFTAVTMAMAHLFGGGGA